MQRRIDVSSSSFEGSSFNSSYRERSSFAEDADGDEDNLSLENSLAPQNDFQTESCSRDSEDSGEELSQDCGIEKSSPLPRSSPVSARRRLVPSPDGSKAAVFNSEDGSSLQHKVPTGSSTQQPGVAVKFSHDPGLVRKPITKCSLQPSDFGIKKHTTLKTTNVVYSSKISPKATKNVKSATKVEFQQNELLGDPGNVISLIVFIFLVVISIVVAVLIYPRTSHEIKPEEMPQTSSDQMLGEFLESFDELSGSFPSQTQNFWKVLRSGMRSIIIPEIPIQPAVFIVVVPRDADPTARCVVRKFADVVTRAFKGRSPVEFTQHLRGTDAPRRVKKVIDDALGGGFSGGSRVAIIHELNKLHGEAAMMFHGYCDNENAKFTRVAIVFTLHVDALAEEADYVVEKELSKVWKTELDHDTLFPLLSRIGNRNVFVRQESEEVLHSNGCI